MEEKNFYEIKRSVASTALLKYLRHTEKYTNLEMADLLEEYYPNKIRSYIVKEDHLPLEGKYTINNIKEF